MVRAVKPWPAKTDCPLDGFEEFKDSLNKASYHNAAEGHPSEAGLAREATRRAAQVAIDEEWPVWAMERMFREIRPLVAWDGFMQTYVNILFENQK